MELNQNRLYNAKQTQSVSRYFSTFIQHIDVVQSLDNTISLIGPSLGYVPSEEYEKYKSLYTSLSPNGYKKGLLLGLGEGILVSVLTQMFPGIDLTAIEIDPIRERIARDQFHLDSLPALQIIFGDATETVETLEESYDLIHVDLCLDGRLEQKCYTIRFWESLLRLLAPQGQIIFEVREKYPNNLNPIYSYLFRKGMSDSRLQTSNSTIHYFTL